VKSNIKKLNFLIIFLILCTLCPVLFNGCTNGTPNSPRTLAENNWAPYTYGALIRLIANNGVFSQSYDHNRKPYAIFDFDNTTVINDVEEALLVYQLENLVFKITPDDIIDVLETGVPDVNAYFNEAYNNKAGQRVTVAMVARDCENAYRYLYANYAGFNAGGTTSLADIKMTNQYKEFTTKIRYLYEAINGTFESSVGYPWVTYLFTGMLPSEVQTLAEKSNDYWLNYGGFTKITWTSPETYPSETGVVSTSFKTGIAVPKEMQDLYATLMDNGIEVYICSASFHDVIIVFGTNPKYGFKVPAKNIFAMRLKKDDSGRYIHEFDNDYFQTQGKGKTQTINAFIRGKHHNMDPVFVAGDSAGDYNMMTDFDGIQLGLILNRYKNDAIKELSQIAASTIGNTDARYVLQGRDENTGTFRRSEKSILLGETQEVLVRE
jgi:predicted peroxiredoxin